SRPRPSRGTPPTRCDDWRRCSSHRSATRSSRRWKRRSLTHWTSPRPARSRRPRNCCATSSRSELMAQSLRRAPSLVLRTSPPSPRTISYVEAVREATDQEMARDSSVVLFGLDVDDPKAIQGTTRGLAEKYGSDRVFGTPLSEDAMTGAAV